MMSFFFSSRRRHTRCYRDWSSDVCSSDLALSVPPDETAPLVYEYLRQIGVSNKAPPPKDDLWTLGMGSHPEGRWRVALGATEMNRLLSLNALANSRTSFAPSSEYTMDPYALTVLKAADGELIGADDDDEGPIQHL